MISKELIHLPGADPRKSVILAFLQTLGALAETVILVVAVWAVGSICYLLPPAWATPLVGSPLSLTLVLMGMVLVRALTQVASGRISSSLSAEMGRALSDRLYLSLFDGDGRETSTQPHQSLAMVSTEGVKSVTSYFTGYLPTFLQVTMMIPVTLLVLVPVNWAAALVIVIGMLALPFVSRKKMGPDTRVQIEQLHKYDKVGVHFEEALRGLDTLKIFDADQAQADRLAEESEGFRRSTMLVLAGQLTSLIRADAVIYASVMAAVLAAVLTGWSSGDWLLPSIIVAAAGVRLFAPERQFCYMMHAGVVAVRQGKAIAAIIDSRAGQDAVGGVRADGVRDAMTQDGPVHDEGVGGPRASDRGNDGPWPSDGGGAGHHAAADLDAAAVGLKARGLSFTYPDGFRALSGIDFALPARGHVGVVGASGSGKSTLASVLCGRLKGYKGSLTLDGYELSGMASQELIDRVTVVRGIDRVFTGTVRSNLDPAGLGYGDERMEEALRQVDLYSLLEEEGGLDRTIDPSGSNLSGGQRQRLSIARGLLRQTPVYIFDEATSAVDRDHDAALAALMDRLGRRALVVTITHRLAGVRAADQILLLDRGRLVERGDFDHLMARDGRFAAQWREQESYENLEVAR